MANTTVQTLPYPDYSDHPNIPDDIRDLATSVESRLVMRFTNSSTRDTAIPIGTAVEGMMCCLTTTKEYQIFTTGAWRTIYSGDGGTGVVRWGHVVNYLDSNRPATPVVGTIGYSRTSGKLEAYGTDNAWHPVAARPATTMYAANYGFAFNVTNGAIWNSTAATFTLAQPTYLMLEAFVEYRVTDPSGAGNAQVWNDVMVQLVVSHPSGTSFANAAAHWNRLEPLTVYDSMVILDYWNATVAGSYSVAIRATTTAGFSSPWSAGHTHINVTPILQGNVF